MPHDYSLYGLNLRSDLLLPELWPAAGQARSNVRIRAGAGDAPGFPDGEMHPLGEGAAFHIRGVATYVIRGGEEIEVWPDRGAPAENVRLYLLGSALGMLLHQRGVLPLHANAVEVDGQAFAFLGGPGAGKSTLAAAMEASGRPIVADDVCAVTFGAGSAPTVAPGLPRLRLWRNSVEALGGGVEGLPRSYAGDERYDKYDAPLRLTVREPVELGALFVLGEGDEFAWRRLEGAEAVSALVENIYRGSWAALAGSLETHWRTCMRLAAALPVMEVKRPCDFDQLEETTGQMLALCRTSVRGVGVASTGRAL